MTEHNRRPKICVIGAGVVGLGAAHFIRNIQRGGERVEVTVIAEEFHPNITSSIAAGFWAVLDIITVTNTKQRPKLRKWAVSTWDHINKLNCSEAAFEAGTCLSFGYSLLETPKPDFFSYWRDTFFNFRPMSERELEMFPPFKHGYSYTTLISDSTKYIPWLMNKLRGMDVRFVKRKVKNFDELASEFDVMVNCTGLGAAHLCDSSVKPGRGQLIKVHAPWVKEFVISETKDNFFYIFPGPNDVALGGTYQKGNWSRELDEVDRKKIWEGCCNLMPSLKKAQILSDKVGLRPLRDSVRLDRELISTPHGKKWVVHNYGHGGAGITLHWGCGEEAASLVGDCLEDIARLTAKL